MTRRQQLELLNAIDAGKIVQFQGYGADQWNELPVGDNQVSFYDTLQYRIRPEPKTVWVKSYSVCYSTPECRDGWTKFMEVME